jgi:hypothetical protein
MLNVFVFVVSRADALLHDVEADIIADRHSIR